MADQTIDGTRPEEEPNWTDHEDNTLLTSIDKGLGRLVLNRPTRRNALDLDLAMRLLRGIKKMDDNPEVRVIVISGAGSAFCAGDDLQSLEKATHGERSALPAMPGSGDAIYLRIAEAIIQARKPVVAAVNGVAAGAGTELACAADLRIASDEARIGSGLVKVGHLGNLALLGRTIGMTRATEIFLTGRLVPADEALAIGLVDRVVPAAEFDRLVEEYVMALAAGPTSAIGLFKELRERIRHAPVEQALCLQAAYHLRCDREVRDAKEGVLAFVEGREALFTGQ